MARELLSVVLATTNPRKQSELRALLGDLPVNWLGAGEALGHAYAPPDELGATLEENACIKARAASDATGLVALADDSGLEVEALGWRPGVRSASFAHDRATDAENNAALLSALQEVPEAERVARFRTVLVVYSPWHGEVARAEGSVVGRITSGSVGAGGFGYDPLLQVDLPSGRSLAELSAEERAEVGHRARAARALRPLLISRLNVWLDEVERFTG